MRQRDRETDETKKKRNKAETEKLIIQRDREDKETEKQRRQR